VPAKQELETKLRSAGAGAQSRKKQLDVNAGEHQDVGDYPSRDHRMPVCCDTIIEKMKNRKRSNRDTAPKGHGGSLTIRYRLSR
jgi:hypothetical protein